jgi:hypothetical protein
MSLAIRAVRLRRMRERFVNTGKDRFLTGAAL